jgi:hypothetical protein
LLSSAVTVIVTASPTEALAGALTEKWVAVAAFATPVASNEIGTPISAAATKRAYRRTRVFARVESAGEVTSLIVPPLSSGPLARFRHALRRAA